MNLYTTILLEFLLITASILFLFKFRKRLGLAPLYILLGSVQYLQALSGTMISFKVFGEFPIYPGSVIVFSAVLFALLLIYIKEGVTSARALIIGIIISNFILSALFGLTYVQEVETQNSIDVASSSVFLINYKFFIAGTSILLVDFILLVIIYQFLISRIGNLYFFLVLFISLVSVLIFDAFAFNVILRYDEIEFKTSLIGHIIGKSFSALAFSVILYSYLKFIDKEKNNATFITNKSRDIFSILKDREKHKSQIEKKLSSQLEATLNHVSDGFVSLDTNWRYTYLNIKAGEFLGRTPESLIGKHIWTEFPDGVGLPFYNVYYKAAETQQTQYFEDYYEPFDKWFENRVYPSPDGLTIYFTDITEQKKAELALKESENRINTILETEPECIKQLNAKGELVYMNPAGLAMIEADNIDMVKGESVINLISPDYQFEFKKLTKNVFKGISGILKFEIIGLKGTKRWLETHAVPLKDSDGNIISLLGITRDITDRKEADTKNQMLLSLIETSDDFVSLVTLEGKPIYLNRNGRKLVGIGNSITMPESILDFFPDDDKESISKTHIPAIMQHGKWKGEAQFQYFKTGALIPIQMSGFLINDSSNKPIALGIVATDFTERKKAEEQIIKSKKYLDNIINNIGDPVFVKDEQSRFLIANNAFYSLFNRTKEEIIGKDFAEDIPEEERERYLSIDNQVLSTGVPNIYEDSFEVEGGPTRFISTKKTRFKDKLGNKYLIGVIRDITERKNAEVQLRKSEKYLENILNNIGDPVFVKNEQSQMLLVNDALCSIFNLTRDNIIGKTLAENVPPKERDSFLRIDKQVISTGIENVNEETLSLDQKEKRTISTKKTRFIDSSGNKYLIGVIRDITEAKKAEKEILALGNRNTLIIETLLDGFILADTTGKILDANPSYLNMTGYTLKELLTMNINQLEVALNQTEIEERIKEMVSKGFARFNSNHQKRNGEIIDLDVNTFAMQVNEQHVVAAFVKDITESKKAAKELEKYKNQLEDLVKRRTKEVDTKNTELQRMNKLFVGRELRMKELKKIIKMLRLKEDE